LESDILIINKFSNSLDNILEIFSSSNNFPSSLVDENSHQIHIQPHPSQSLGVYKISIIEFLSTLLSLTRNHIILEKFIQYKFFDTCWSYLFTFSNNNIFHSYLEKIFNIFFEDISTEDSFFEHFIVKSNFLNECKKFISGGNFIPSSPSRTNSNLNILNDKEHSFLFYHFSNGRKIYKGYFVQIAKLSMIIYNNYIIEKSPVKKYFQKSDPTVQRFLEEFLNFYEFYIQAYVEKMNIALGNYKNNQRKIKNKIIFKNFYEFFPH
jgi:hypothetical protein